MAFRELKFTALERYIATNIASTNAYLMGTGNVVRSASLSAMVNARELKGHPAPVEIIPFCAGASANNVTGEFKIWTVDYGDRGVEDSSSGLTKLYIARLFATVGFTCGNLTGADGTVVDDSERFVDTIGSVTLSDWGTFLQTQYGATIEERSPTNDEIASLHISDLGDRWGYILDPKTTGNITSMNWLVKRGGI